MTDGERWAFVRDVLWKNVKRSDLPPEMHDYLGDMLVDIKYPSARDLDETVEALAINHGLGCL
jgi:hypothetical protein